uniref:Si:ch211-193l2.10 n=1 Tax=Oryzias sinensis TaxID=183150 RepID=A0A8C7Z2A5_9TELE
MRGLLTTQSQNCYKEQIQRELLTRLAWKSRYAKLYPSALSLQGSTQLPPLPPGVHVSSLPLLYLQGIGRSLYLQRRGHIRPEEKFDFPLLSSWEYGWRLGDFTLDYRTPSHARSAVVEKTFYSKNGVFRNPSATDSMG